MIPRRSRKASGRSMPESWGRRASPYLVSFDENFASGSSAETYMLVVVVVQLHVGRWFVGLKLCKWLCKI